VATTPFKPMLAEDARLDRLRFPLCIQPKLDGVRISVVDGVALTRQLKPIPNKEISTALSKPQFNGFDGELIVGGATDPMCYRRTMSCLLAHNTVGAPWQYVLFDKWDHLGTYIERHHALIDQHDRYVSPPLSESGRFQLLHHELVHDEDEMALAESEFLEMGYEGAILRDPAGLYKFGRASAIQLQLLKLKRNTDSEAEVIEPYEEMHNANEATINALGETERSSVQANLQGKDCLGGFQCRDLKTGVEFRCGTGYDRETRKALWEEWKANPYPGRILKYRYFGIGAYDKPRFPVWLGWRDPIDMDEETA
jgi:DNA ligase-1